MLVGPTVDAYARSFGRQVGRLALDCCREPPSLLPILVSDYLTAGPLRVLRTGLNALADPIEDKLAAVDAPTLVVRGSRDALTSQRWVEDVARRLPAATLLVIPGSPHAANYAAAAQLARAVEAFLVA